MKFIVLAIIAILALHATAIECPAYKCDETLKDKQCAIKLETEVKLKVCTGKNEICPLPANIDDESYCTNTTGTNLLPGDYCTVATQCLSGNCAKSSVCVGKAEEAECKSDAECDVGLYCDGKKCVKTALFGEACSDVIKCDPAAICHDSVCVARAQLAAGDNSAVPALCQTFYVNEGKCVKGPTFAGKSKDCPAEGFCDYTFNGKTEQRACVCGKSEKTAGYCELGHGDVSLDDVIYSISSPSL